MQAMEEGVSALEGGLLGWLPPSGMKMNRGVCKLLGPRTKLLGGATIVPVDVEARIWPKLLTHMIASSNAVTTTNKLLRISSLLSCESASLTAPPGSRIASQSQATVARDRAQFFTLRRHLASSCCAMFKWPPTDEVRQSSIRQSNYQVRLLLFAAFSAN